MPDPFDLQYEPPPYEESDKRQHALVGAAMRFGLEDLAGGPEEFPRWARVLAPAAAAVGKEMLDRQDPEHHQADWKDAAATALGSALAYRSEDQDLAIIPTISDDMVALDVLLRF